MEDSYKYRLFYFISIAFIVLNSVAITQDILWLGILPVVFLFALLVLFKLDAVLLMLSFIIPLSVNIDNIGFGLGISLPSEPLLMLIMVLALFKFLIDAQYDFKVFKHPISIVIVLNIIWTIITTFSSELPITSAKFLLSKLWFVVVFYFLGVPLFKKQQNIHRYIWFYGIALLFVIFYTLKVHSEYGLSQKFSYTVGMPFFVSHGVYASALCYILPLLVCYLVFPKVFKLNLFSYSAIAFVAIMFFVGLFFSFTRASWLSVAVAMVILIPISLRISFNTILLLLFSTIALVFVFQNQLMYLLSKNNQESSKNYFEHIRSASNIKTDASNTERLNRWSCAIDMFMDRPIVGFGPGTYSFVYGPYQLSRNRTIISTDYGDGGNAHSEYLQPLSETGLIGMLLVLALVYTTLSTGFRIFYTASQKHVKYQALGILLGMLTYYVHGLLNNYSETDKIACLFWSFMAMLTAIDLYHNKKQIN